MLKALCICMLFLYFQINLFSQHDEKRDYLWLFGKKHADSIYTGGSIMDFNTNPITYSTEAWQSYFETLDASICDTEGNLLFYTNGFFVYNASHEIMENGDSINPSSFRDDWIDLGYRLVQGAIILPLPGHPFLYYLIHEELEWGGFQGNVAKVPRIYYTLIDMEQNNGLGAVLEKNQVILQDTLDFGKITATRHGNGRDWWIVIPEFSSDGFYSIPLTISGVGAPIYQQVGDTSISGLGQSVFSPDGSKYIRLSLLDESIGGFLDIYNFNRCTGTLSNHLQILFSEFAYAGGVAVSPNSRFLYLNYENIIYQYDLTKFDIAASQRIVAEYDGFIDIAPTTFFLSQLAPDGKIYINVPNSVFYLHVINQPNEIGLSCNVLQHHIKLPRLNYFSLPNFPNFRLGALQNSPCDTIEIVSAKDVIQEGLAIKVFPNPVQDKLFIEIAQNYSPATISWLLLDVHGRLLMQNDIEAPSDLIELEMSSLENGIYFYQIHSETKLLKTGKIVVQQ